MQNFLSLAVSVLQILYRQLQNSQHQTLTYLYFLYSHFETDLVYCVENVVLTRMCEPKRLEVTRGNEECIRTGQGWEDNTKIYLKRKYDLDSTVLGRLSSKVS
jgi:hypothetical protein